MMIMRAYKTKSGTSCDFQLQVNLVKFIVKLRKKPIILL
jgi:hypothetical protein